MKTELLRYKLYVADRVVYFQILEMNEKQRFLYKEHPKDMCFEYATRYGIKVMSFNRPNLTVGAICLRGNSKDEDYRIATLVCNSEMNARGRITLFEHALREWAITGGFVENKLNQPIVDYTDTIKTLLAG